MIPMRDGARLQTAIFTPTDRHGPLPILVTRTPYGVPSTVPAQIPHNLKELALDGYVFVYQNVRGRFKSEGTFEIFPPIDLSDPRKVSETTDAWDTVDWLVKNVPSNNGRVGMYGVSYDGLTTAYTLLRPHPLRDHDHVFLKGHRLMIQVQSTWFPVIDRNPQRYVPSISQAKASDFVKATQRVYEGSYVTLPVMP